MCIRRGAVCYLQGVEPPLQHGTAGLGDLTRASLVCIASRATDKIRPEQQLLQQQQQERTVRACARATGVFKWTKMLTNTSCRMCRTLLPEQLIVHPAGVREENTISSSVDSYIVGLGFVEVALFGVKLKVLVIKYQDYF